MKPTSEEASFVGGDWEKIPGIFEAIQSDTHLDPFRLVEIPGLLEFLDAKARGPLSPDNLLPTLRRERPGFKAHKQLVYGRQNEVPQVYDRDLWHQLIDFLSGYRLLETRVENATVWMPLVRLWPVPKGKVGFEYQDQSEDQAKAEVKIFGIGGGASLKTQLIQAVKFPPSEMGLSYDVRVGVTIKRYTNDSNHTFDEVSVVGAGPPVFRSIDLAPNSHPLPGNQNSESLKEKRFEVYREELGKQSSHDVTVKLSSTTDLSWTVDATVVAPKPKDAFSLTLSAKCSRSTSFSSTFVLPRGRDYAFCRPRNQNPLGPICIDWMPESTSYGG